jgi:hypothetical protein
MQIPGYTGGSGSSQATPGTDAAGRVQPASADPSQSDGSTPSGTPSSFSTTLMRDMLASANGAGNFDALPSSAKNALSGAGLPPPPPGEGLAFETIFPQGVADDVVGAVGSDGQVNLSQIDSMLGVTASSDPNSPGAAIADEWQKIAGSSTASMSTGQLATAIQSFLKAQDIESAPLFTPDSGGSMTA